MCQGTLVFCAGSGYSPWDDFAAFCCKIPKRFCIFVIDNKVGVGTETAYFPPVEYSFFSGGAGSIFSRNEVFSHFITPIEPLLLC